MKNKKTIVIITIVISIGMILGLGFLAFNLKNNREENIKDNKNDVVYEKASIDTEEVEDVEEESVTSSNLILFNINEKEISYNNDGEQGKSYYINGEKLEEVKTSTLDTKGLIPYKSDNRLFFVDLDLNTLVEISIKNNELDIDLVLNNIDEDIQLENIKEISVIDDLMFVVMDEGKVLEINLNNKVVKKYTTELNPAKLFKLNGEFYFMDRANLVKNKEVEGKLIEVARLELGAMLSDFKVDEGYLYALSMFGKKENNSVLIKVNLANLEVKDMMPLKGIDSKFIGFKDNMAYIGQKDSIKEINFDTFEPLRAFKREQEESIKYGNSNLYKLIDGQLKVINLDDVKVLNSFQTNFDDFFLANVIEK